MKGKTGCPQNKTEDSALKLNLPLEIFKFNDIIGYII